MQSPALGRSNPFAEGSLAHALIETRAVIQEALRLAPPWRLWALIRLQGLVEAVEQETGVAVPDRAGLRPALVALLKDRCLTPPLLTITHCPAEQLEASLDRDPQPLLERMAAGLFLGERASYLHVVEMEVRAGRRTKAESLCDDIRDGATRRRAERLARTGVLSVTGRRRRFIAPITGELDRWAPSLPLVIAAALGGRLADARRIARRLPRPKDANLWFAVAEEDAAYIQRSGNRSRRDLALLELVQRAGPDLARARRHAARIEGRGPRSEAELHIARMVRASVGHGYVWIADPCDDPISVDVAAARMERFAGTDWERALEEYDRVSRWLRHAPRPRGRSASIDAPPRETPSPLALLLDLRLAAGAATGQELERLPRGVAGTLWSHDQRLPHLCAVLRTRSDGGAAWLPALHHARLSPDAVRARVLVDRVRALTTQRYAGELRAPAGTPELAFVRGLAGDSAHAESLPEELRAFFDRGVALSPEAGRRRRVLTGACKSALHRAFTGRSRVDPDVVECRLQTLVDLGGGKAASAVACVLSAAPNRRHAVTAFEALCRIDLRQATTLLFERYFEVTGAGAAGVAMLKALERHRAVEEGYTRLWVDAVIRTRQLLARDVHRWLGRAVAEWWRLTGRPIPQAALTAMAVGELRPEGAPEDQIRRLFGEAQALGEASPRRLIGKLIARPLLLKTSLCFLAPRIAGADAWPEERWRAALSRIEQGIGTVARDVVSAYARTLDPHGPARLARRLLAGRNPATEARRVPLGGAWSLRYLDKTRNLFAFLRFPDAVSCCFHSGGDSYTSPQLDAQRQILSLWKDPLSFCFAVERQERTWSEQHGFVFGSFGTMEDQPIALLNGVYLRRQDQALRIRILRAIEASFSRPLGLVAVGVAAVHGGAGALPPDYEVTPLRVRRWRALRDASGDLVRSVYDDIGSDTNREGWLALHWKRL